MEVDLKGYFDAIPHDRLMALVREPIADERVLGLIEGFLKQGVMEDTESAKAMEGMPEDESQEESQGTPQGGVICRMVGWGCQSGHVAIAPLSIVGQHLPRSVGLADGRSSI